MIDAVVALLEHAQSAGGKWPLPRETKLLSTVNTWRAMYAGDRDRLKEISGWNARGRPYRVDPLPERIADAWAHYLFGEDPRVTTAAEADAPLMAELLEVNDFASELERAASLCVAEGEIWPRVYVDELAAPRPLVEWVSRRNVLPLWLGPRLVAAAVVTELPPPDDAEAGAVFRHFEVHAPGVVANALYIGKSDKLGTLADLDRHPSTADLLDIWETGLAGMLLGRVPNRIRGDRRCGVSDFAGVKDVLLDLNEAAAIGASNMRLTARKRAVIAGRLLNGNGARDGDLSLTPEEGGGATANVPRARFDAAEEVFVEDPVDVELGKDSTDPFRVIEYDFDAAALIEWKRDLVETALTRVGLTPQYVGAASSSNDGYAISGTALRLRLIATDKTGRGKARYWDDAVPKLLATMAQLDGSSAAGRGFSRRWQDATTPPAFERRPGLPIDEVEEAMRHQTLVNAGVESIETAVRSLHPDWTDDQITDEVGRIRTDKQSGAGSMFPTGV